MTIHVGLTHTTTYSYDRTIRLAPHTVRLRPAPHTRTPILSYALKVTPERHFINWQQDPFGNYLARFVFPERTDRFEVVVDLTASMTAIDPFDFFLEEEAEDVPFTYDDKLKQDLAPYLALDAAREIEAFRSLLPEQNMSTVDYFVTVNQRVYEEIAYVIRMEPGVQTPAQTLALKKGSCRDSAWLLANLLRLEGYATRFVSGYLIQLTADEKAIGGPQGPAADFTDLHAWCEVYAPGAGWIGLDPTSGLFTGEGHIPLAATPLPGSAAPIEGAHEAAEVAFDFSMKVDRIYEAPRVSKPYTEEEWRRIDAVGQAVDARLEEGDVRLTMGGEPTFVAADDFDGDEWNIEAVGPTKRRYADDLARRLQKRFAPGGAIQHGDGKWYPGEPLPRWAFSVFWRTDGAPVWENDEFIAREDAPSSIGAEDVRRFSESLCAALELEPDYAQAIYEDPAEYLLRERKLAPDIDPRDNRLESPEDRARLGKIFDRGLTTPAGFVIPLYQSYEPTPYPQQPQARDGGRRRAFCWRSERWRTRRGALFLLPGDSAAGFRLPLRSLAYVDPDAAPSPIPLDPFAPRGPLPPRLQRRAAPAAENEPGWRPIDGETESDATPIAGGVPGPRTAFALEERDGVLCVFFPPVESADAFMDLLAAVEETATDLAIPVRLEGYPPPPDHRIQSVKVTPDPGVIEVNVQPGATWAEQRAITETLYEEARGVGLTAAKFMPDGRPVGSG
ncbi:MAG: transglutaminase family protein, partial [Pseudomonadota bacterium]